MFKGNGLITNTITKANLINAIFKLHHDIVADGRVGASYSIVFTDQRPDRRTDRRTDGRAKLLMALSVRN